MLINLGADPVMQRVGRRWLDEGPQMAANMGKRHMDPKVKAIFRGESVSAEKASERVVRSSAQELR